LQSLGGNTVRLPKPFHLDQLRQALTDASGSAPQPNSPAIPEVRNRLRALVVDDSSAARIHIRNVLTELGPCHIVEASDGAEAIGILEKESFDLVVTDYTMPRLDGRGLIDYIRNRSSFPKVPVIVVTTETDPAKLDAVQRLGVSAICDKSFRPDAVRAIVERLG
jgi:two-component system chemotaxis response regulator CheY